jgi:hypothetical protein
METFWMVYGEGQGCSAPAMKHGKKAAAIKEAERLALSNPGKKFYLLEAVSVCVKQAVEWQNLIRIPF